MKKLPYQMNVQGVLDICDKEIRVHHERIRRLRKSRAGGQWPGLRRTWSQHEMNVQGILEICDREIRVHHDAIRRLHKSRGLILTAARAAAAALQKVRKKTRKGPPHA